MSNNHGMGKLKGIEHFCNPMKDQTRRDRFGRMFPELSPAFTSVDVLKEIGAIDGPMDGGDNANRTGQDVDVGHVFFGQFVDHDITLDLESSLGGNAEASEIGNTRTPTLDLDCIYGAGPDDAPFMYHSRGKFKGVKLMTGADEGSSDSLAEKDLFRSPVFPPIDGVAGRGRAVIGDHRNDENRIISQMQLSMIGFHNDFAEKLSSEYEGHKLFEEARKLATWHYQWLVVNEFLPKLCGEGVVNRILGCGRQFYCPRNGEPFIPIEFSVAAYRFGHSMIPHRIGIQAGQSHFLFGDTLGQGFKPVKSIAGVVDWAELFNINSQVTQKAEKLDTKMAKLLLDLPFIQNGEKSLATRNLLRGNIFMLPAGEKVAEKMGQDEVDIQKVMTKILDISDGKIKAGAPLWLYILAEAEVIGREDANGDTTPHVNKGLGPVGGTIVAETIIGLLELDPRSYLGTNRNWAPTTGPRSIGEMLSIGAPSI